MVVYQNNNLIIINNNQITYLKWKCIRRKSLLGPDLVHVQCWGLWFGNSWHEDGQEEFSSSCARTLCSECFPHNDQCFGLVHYSSVAIVS